MSLDQHNTEFNNLPYNEKPYVSTHNCYDYAIGHFDKNQKKKSQPGRTVLGNELVGKDVRDCKFVEDRLLMDHPELSQASVNSTCPPGFHKIGLMVDPDDDYHFIRQDDDGTWSHKPGNRKIMEVDFSGKIIEDPTTADFNDTVGQLNYTSFCGAYCVKEDGHFQTAVEQYQKTNKTL
jgi:hypothetical protein